MSSAVSPKTSTAREMFLTICSPKSVGERHLVDLIIGRAGDAQAAGLAHRFKPYYQLAA
jgi:hypothetical protein